MEVMSPDGHVESSHQSGISRFFNSIIAAVCVAPLILLLVVFLVGYNEKRDVCESRALDAGLKSIQEGACDSYDSSENHLVLFTCKLSKADKVDLSKLTLGPFSDELSKSDRVNVGLKINVEMKQCKEVKKSSTTKDKGGGGGTTTETQFTYETVWSSQRIDSSKFNAAAMKNEASGFKKNCHSDSGETFQNPAFPILGESAYADSVKLEAYTVTDKSYIASIPLTKPAVKDGPEDWKEDCGDDFHWCTKDSYKVDGKKVSDRKGIGKVRVKFFTYKKDDNDKMTVLGLNQKGTVGKWTAPNSWMCSGYQIGGLKKGTVTKDEFLNEEKATSSAITWLLRIGGFLLAWLAFSMMLAPLGVVGDCIPCIGPCIGDAVEAIACAVSICPACACTMLVAGIVWIFMRPLVGLACLAISIVIFGVMLYLRTAKPARTVDPLMGGVVRY